jgi:oligopeptide/dipeptide ABC transporter ATP-binding protein
MTATTPNDVLLELRGVRTHFGGRPGLAQRLLGRDGGVVRAVDGIDLTIRRGEMIGLVGESGSGKTTLGRTILGLAPATSGEILFEGRDILQMGRRELRRQRRRMQMIFQDPYSSLSPRLRVSYLLTEPYTINDTPEADRYSVDELLEMVELSPEHAGKYPHELSGGQARRIGIARALALRPEFIVADEPTAGLDVSAAASILNLMQDLGEQLGLTYVLITHNLNLVGYVADRIAAMYLGQLVELGRTESIFEETAHPYTRALISSIAEPDPHHRRGRQKLLLPGELPSPTDPPSGCRFRTRCRFAQERCAELTPELEVADPEHVVACHFWQPIRAGALEPTATSAPLAQERS